MKLKHKPTLLMILDGFGINEEYKGNAIAQANAPKLKEIIDKNPHCILKPCGEYVGLPKGQMGNSEVGHLNIGAGRIIYQELSRISKAIEDGDFFENPAFVQAMSRVVKNQSSLHLLGLVSDGGVHSHLDHLFALIDLAKKEGVQRLYIHCFLDGRDVPPRCAIKYLDQLQKKLDQVGIGQISTISGRYYAMDRDKRYDRVELAYKAITSCEGICAKDYKEAMDLAYDRGENDEFVKPTYITGKGVLDGDSIIMFNYRPDRAREITRAFVDPNFDGFKREREIKDLFYVTMTQYDSTMPSVCVAFAPETYKNTLGEYVSSLGLKQLRIAETEKYAHVTFFFNGGVEEANPGEDRILVPSPKVATYDMQPEMSAYIVTEKLIDAIENKDYDMIILNFANPDMVGHTGNLEATIKAIEDLELCIPKIVDAVMAKGGQVFLTADHGNSDLMIDEEGNVVTSHSLNDVPFVYIGNENYTLKDSGKLADIAPTMLYAMGLKIPDEMTGDNLIIE